MKPPIEVHCIVCQLVFCCGECRWKHEKTAHGLLYNCPICRKIPFLCKPDELNQHFIQHLAEKHLPLECKKCNKVFQNMEHFIHIGKCMSISELVEVTEDITDKEKVEVKFDSLYEKVSNKDINIEDLKSIDKTCKTAVITPMMKRNYLVDYEDSESELEDTPKTQVMKTPHAKLVPKTPKFRRQRAATPHVRKFLGLTRQRAIDEYDETVDDENEVPPAKTTPARNENDTDTQTEMTTPTSHLAKIALAVTTSTPTNPATNVWSEFPGQGTADSPLSEIENAESPAQSVDEPSKSESDNVPQKLKSIIVTGSRIRLGSQDSSEKQVTFQDTANSESSSMKVKKVKFAEDTVFEQQKMKRVFRKPKRMLTPGPQKPRHYCNPRFQALINRFENQTITMARTPVTLASTPVYNRDKSPESTPPVGEPSNMPARAINFKDDSPVVESENYSKESNELFRTCVESPVESGFNNAITALTANIAGSVQNCLSTALKTTEEETEIQFKFVITKKKVSVKRIVGGGEGEAGSSDMERASGPGKENIWSTVAKAVKSALWGEEVTDLATTPYRSYNTDSTSSSGSKRKYDQMSDSEFSPLNHKRHKYEGRLRGRPPIHRTRAWVSKLRTSQSAEQESLMSKAFAHDDVVNQSF